MASAWSTEDDDTLRRLHALPGRSLTSIATEMGRSKATVSRHATDLGLTWDRAQVAAATHAKVTDAKARRANALANELAILEYAQAHVLATMRGEAKWQTVMRGAQGRELLKHLDFVPSRDLRDETSSRNAMTAIIAKLDTDDGGASDARSLLERLADRLGVEGATQ